MSREYPCVHYDDGTCRKFTGENIHSWCVEAPCPYQQESNADHIRRMSDEELAKEAADALSYCAPGIRPSPERCTSEMCVECWLNRLKQPYKEGKEC